jgi:pimeloyl-ACP methyl ester carboxylesterase
MLPFVAYSHRFHGSGTWPPDADYSAEAHVDDLLAIIRPLEVGPVHLIGFSTAIVLRATLCESELVRSLIVIESNVAWLFEGMLRANQPALGGAMRRHG